MLLSKVAGPASRPGAGTRSIAVLQLGRALAAIAVVFSHTVVPTNTVVEQMPVLVEALLDYGYLGVDFFFVLSGFIIYYTNVNRYTEPGWAWQFTRSRLSRIYLPYLPIAVGLALLHTASPGHRMGGDPWNWFATLTLIPVGAKSVMGIAWTLTYELAFYALALFFFRSREPIAWACVWAVSIVLGQMVFGSFGSPPPLSIASIFFNPINLEFVFGILAAWAVINGQPKSNLVFLLGGLMCFAAFVADGGQRDHSWMLGLGLAILLVPVVRAEQAGRIRVSMFSVLLGNASYAIYLIHPPLVSAVARVVGRIGPIDSWKVSVLASVFTAVTAGLAYHLIFEKPILRLVSGKPGKSSELRSAPIEA